MNAEEKIILEDIERRLAAIEMRQPLEPDRIYTIAEVAAWLRCSSTNVYDLMSAGELAFTRIGAGRKGFRVRGSDLLSFLDARKEGGPRPAPRYARLGL